MNSADQAILAVLSLTPVALGLYIFGRWRRGEFRLGRDGLVVVATAAWALVLAAAFAGPEVAVLLVPSVGLLLAGGGLWFVGPKSGTARIGAVLAVALGSMGLIGGVLRLTTA